MIANLGIGLGYAYWFLAITRHSLNDSDIVSLLQLLPHRCSRGSNRCMLCHIHMPVILVLDRTLISHLRPSPADMGFIVAAKWQYRPAGLDSSWTFLPFGRRFPICAVACKSGSHHKQRIVSFSPALSLMSLILQFLTLTLAESEHKVNCIAVLADISSPTTLSTSLFSKSISCRGGCHPRCSWSTLIQCKPSSTPRRPPRKHSTEAGNGQVPR
jgi:hypothetical protein